MPSPDSYNLFNCTDCHEAARRHLWTQIEGRALAFWVSPHQRKITMYFRIVIALCVAAVLTSTEANEAFTRELTTYLGGSAFEQIRGLVVDSAGNRIVVGGTRSRDFPTTFGPAFQAGGGNTGGAGLMDVFIVKFDPSGGVLWSRLLGGPNYDRAYDVEVDAVGNIFLSGRAGAGFPTTAGVHQEHFGGGQGGFYGDQDGFVAKLSADGVLQWATYLGSGDNGVCDDILLAPNGDIVIAGNVTMAHATHGVTANSYQTNIAGGWDVFLARLLPDGSDLRNATYYGGSADADAHPSVQMDDTGSIYVMQATYSTDAPVTANALQPANAGERDLIIAKFSADLSSLSAATYFGGSKTDFSEGFTLYVDIQHRVLFGVSTASDDLLQRPQAPVNGAQTGFGGEQDTFIGVLSADFRMLQAGTYLGGSGKDREPQGLFRDRHGRVLIAGASNSADFPVTSGSPGGGMDAYIAVLTPNLDAIVFATLMGGSGDDTSRISYVDRNGAIHIAGQSSSSNLPTLNAPRFGGRSGANYSGNTDGFYASWSAAADAVHNMKSR
jgi:hypothetical protein